MERRRGEGERLDVYDAIAARRSVRQFRPAPVDPAVLERVLKAASMAPSAKDEQPWRFHVAVGNTRLELGGILSQTTAYLGEYVETLGPEEYDRAVAWFSSLGDAPVLAVVTAPESEDEMTATNRMLSVGAALENLLLAATAEGLGACPFTFSYWVKGELSKKLSLPEGWSVACVVALGWPLPGAETVRRAKRSDVAVWLD